MPIFKQLVKRLASISIFQNKNFNNRFVKAMVATVLLNVFFGTAFYLAESTAQSQLTYQDSIWWAMVTMTTVGYGDFYAQSPIGRYLVSYPCMLVGIGIIGYLISALAESMLIRITRFRRGNMTITSKNHIILCNYPSEKKIINLVEELKGNVDFKNRDFVLITDSLEEIPDALIKKKIAFVKGPPTDETVLNAANLADCAGVFVLKKSGNNENSDAHILAIVSVINMLRKELNCAPRVVVELSNLKNSKMMQFAGVEGIISAEGISDRLLVQEFLYPGVHDIIQQIISNSIGSQFYIFSTKLYGHKLKEIQLAVLKHPANLQVIGVMKGHHQLINPSKEYIIDKDDQLIMLANSKEDFESIERDILQN